jgi:zinc protease
LQLSLEQILKKNLISNTKKNKITAKGKKKKTRKHGIEIKLSKNAKRPAPEIHKLHGGATLLLLPQKESPVVSARFGFLGGLRYEPNEFLGVNELTTRIWPAGTKKRTEDEINHAIEDRSAGIGAFGGRNSLGLSMTSLSPDANTIRDILSEILLEPLLSDFAIDREKMLMGEIVKSRRDKPSQRCMQHMHEMMFKGHPYSRDSYGEIESIAKLNRQAVDSYLSQVLDAKGLVVSVVGDIDLKSWQKCVESMALKLPKPGKQPAISALQKINSNMRHFEELKKEQTHMALAFRGIKIDDKDRITLEVMQSILSGQGGRLFIELRDKASLAYSVSPIRMDGLEGGYFGAYIGCSPDKVTKAFEMMQQEFKKLSSERISSKELERSKQYLLGRHDIALQRTGHVADLMLFDQLYGLSFNDFENFKNRLQQVTAESIMSLAQKIFSQNYCLSVVGQKDVSI